MRVNDANAVYQHLVNEGIIVRNRNTVSLCLGCLRITVGTPEENKILLNELKKMYHMRWDIETAFKVLKYIIGMTAFHSKKRNFIQQEIYAAILLHCLTNIITERIEVEQSDKRKHTYKVNLSTAVTNMRLWLRKLIGTEVLIKRIKKYLAPVRPDRKYQRNMKPKSAIPFNTKAS